MTVTVRTLPSAAALAALLALTFCSGAFAAAPTNDDRAAARVLTLPASIDGTTRDATVEATEPFSGCNAGSKRSVWYLVRATGKGRVSVRFDAGDDLDAVVEVLQRQRSQTRFLDCDRSDKDGRAELAFNVVDGGSYLIRVAERPNSASGGFRLDVFIPSPPPTFPGPGLPARGLAASVDLLADQQDAYRVTLRSGVTYRINLSAAGSRCANLAIYGPRATSFDDEPARRAPCEGYLLFTPKAGEGGRHSLLVRAVRGARGAQRYHLQVGRALADDTAPGRFVPNFAKVKGKLDGRRTDVVDLFRFDVVRRSELRLALTAGDDVGLLLLSDRGGRIAGGSGSDAIERRLRPGRYYAAVRAAPQTRGGAYTLSRVSRAITRTRISVPKHSAPGASVPITTRVSGADAGIVAVTIERFDPLAGWQFARRILTRDGSGDTVTRFTPGGVGRYRVRAEFRGTRGAAPSASGYDQVLVAGPLRQ